MSCAPEDGLRPPPGMCFLYIRWVSFKRPVRVKNRRMCSHAYCRVFRRPCSGHQFELKSMVKYLHFPGYITYMWCLCSAISTDNPNKFSDCWVCICDHNLVEVGGCLYYMYVHFSICLHNVFFLSEPKFRNMPENQHTHGASSTAEVHIKCERHGYLSEKFPIVVWLLNLLSTRFVCVSQLNNAFRKWWIKCLVLLCSLRVRL